MRIEFESFERGSGVGIKALEPLFRLVVNKLNNKLLKNLKLVIDTAITWC